MDYRDMTIWQLKVERDKINAELGLRTNVRASPSEAEQQDTKRYQWLRKASVSRGDSIPENFWNELGDALDEEFDKMIDQAIADNEHAALYSRSGGE